MYEGDRVDVAHYLTEHGGDVNISNHARENRRIPARASSRRGRMYAQTAVLLQLRHRVPPWGSSCREALTRCRGVVSDWLG